MSIDTTLFDLLLPKASEHRSTTRQFVRGYAMSGSVEKGPDDRVEAEDMYKMLVEYMTSFPAPVTSTKMAIYLALDNKRVCRALGWLFSQGVVARTPCPRAPRTFLWSLK